MKNESEIRLSEKRKRIEEQSQLVEDDFFEKGHRNLKVRQISVGLLLWVILLFPVLVTINSVGPHRIWRHVYRWEFVGATSYASLVIHVLAIALIVVILAAFGFLLRNNRQVLNIFPRKATYNKVQQEKRLKVLNEMYAKRFGEAVIREGIPFYEVKPEQNLSDDFVAKLFKEERVDK